MGTLTQGSSVQKQMLLFNVWHIKYLYTFRFLQACIMTEDFVELWVTSAGENRGYSDDKVKMLWATIVINRACLLKHQVLSLVVKLLTNWRLKSFLIYATLSCLLFIYSKPLSNMFAQCGFAYTCINVQHWKFEHMQSVKHGVVLITPTHTPAFSSDLLASNS